MDKSNVIPFLRLYESYPCLWNPNIQEYKDVNSRVIALKSIIQRMGLKMTVAELKLKIKNIRTTYKREAVKVARSKKSDAGTVYKPQLMWYPVADRFLRPIIDGKKSKVNLDPEDEEDEESRASGKRAASPPTVQVSQPKRAKPVARPVRRPTQPSVAARPEHSHDPCASCAVSNYLRRRDEAEIIAKGWALELEKMDEMQQLFAKKAINDIIVEGRLGNLHRDAVQITPPTPQQPTAAWFEMEQEEEEQDPDESESEYEVKPMFQSDPMPGTSTS